MEHKRIDYPIACSKYYLDNKRVTLAQYSRAHWGRELSNFCTKTREGNNGVIYTHTMNS